MYSIVMFGKQKKRLPVAVASLRNPAARFIFFQLIQPY